ncbi:alpha-galactosidase [Georgenia sp. TF02-10]|uniref:alpha-galactosidase n=1 Tax=Georgenia sp. TF02-10 TaxID=2917725 RepID=UPI001FA8044C|nr:alpha-galactosidase [Georgenia sp. TF02-10]UNX53233.1 alpha-galactosidase [Georgenia sp. TF02-10]
MSAPEVLGPHRLVGPHRDLLRRDGVSVLLETAGESLPRVLHWGADLGRLSEQALAAAAAVTLPAVPRNALDTPWPLSLLPGQADGWLGRPGLAAHRGGTVLYPRWVTRSIDVGAHHVTVDADDTELGIALTTELELRPGGLLRARHTLGNTGGTGLAVERLEVLLPLPDLAGEVLDLTGRWAKERVPQRAALQFGARVRESRRGRTGHDAALVLYAGTPSFTDGAGRLWGVHVATSGNHVHAVERLPEGAGGSAAVLGGGELLEAGEVLLGADETYTSPWVYFAYSDAGLDGAAARFHDHLRSRPTHPTAPRPLVLNTWEAVYLNHDEAKLLDLADRAAAIGVERFVLDDGWFHGRRTERSGLGDWWVDGAVWPRGLGRLADRVRDLGMELGLWVEPEMANPDSELLRRHPDWALAAPGRWPRTARHQVVLNLARPEVSSYLFEAIATLVRDYGIAYLKWDHNRDVHEPVHEGRGGVHRQTLALYALLDRLRATFPGLEIESCASGGARIDLGILEHTDRVWTSDNNDPLERQRIQRWTSQLIPLELQGAHVGPPQAHTTGRRTSLQFRALTALLGHAGIEWDITGCTNEELGVLRAWAGLYRELRPLLHTGRLVRPDHADEDAVLTGVVGADQRRAVFLYARLDTAVAAGGERIRLTGLREDALYEVRVRRDLGEVPTMDRVPPPWMAEPLLVPGRVLAELGLAAPQLLPQEAMLLDLSAVRV